MLFFLMKMDGRLRLQLFLLVLIVGIGILPDKTNGADPRCYECDIQCYFCGVQDASDCSNGTIGDKKPCPSDRSCLVKYELINGMFYLFEKSCDLKLTADCVKKEYPTGGGCLVFGGGEDTSKLSNCVQSKLSSRTLNMERTLWPGQRVKKCYCDGDFCNDEVINSSRPLELATSTPKTRTNSEVPMNASSRPLSNGLILFIILSSSFFLGTADLLR